MPEKEKAQDQNKTAPPPALDATGGPPNKDAGPQSGALPSFPVSSTTSAPKLARTADLLAGGKDELGAAERSRMTGSMQENVGNARVGRMFGTAAQAKTEVSSPDDSSEKEADHVADQVMRTSASETEKTELGAPVAPPETAGTGGQPLSKADRDFMEPRFGQDLGHVRLHTDREAQQQASGLRAKAFTQGSDISFAAGSGPEDKKLLAHELTHVTQQDGDQVRRSSSPASGTVQRGTVQRVLAIAGTDLNAAGLTNAENEMVRTHLADIVNNTQGDLLFTRQYRANLIRDTIRDMHRASDRMNSGSIEELARDVRQRVLMSLYMRQSQGSRTWRMAFSYPDRPSDGTAGVGARVNEAAIAYWGPVQDPTGDYFFEMNNVGRADPYQAIVKLFTEQTNPHLRTLMHCDYVVSVIQYRSWIESIGVARFNQGVRTGVIPAPVLKWNGFEDMERVTSIPGVGGAPATSEQPLISVQVANEADLIIGDHVVFYNHESYDALSAGDPRAIWRLENAIVIDRRNGENRYQGHGYFSPVPKSRLLAGMIRQYNMHVHRARTLTNAVDRARGARRTAALQRLHQDYPNVRERVGGGWEISGNGLCDRPVTRELRDLTASDAPGLIDPCSGHIWVRRPVHTR